MEAIAAIITDLAILAKPALFNIYFAAASIPIGFVLAVFVALGKASRSRLVSSLSRGFIYAFRGSPFFIQLFMFYSLALAFNLSLWKPLGIDTIVLNPLILGPTILALNTTAYSAEIFYGALIAVPKGEVEAARAFGMSRPQLFRSVVWPNMIRLAWPAYTNEVVVLFHTTALVYFTLPVINDEKDLMNKAGELFEKDYNAFLHFPVAGLYFLGISMLVFFIFGRIYRHLMRHLPQAPAIRFSPRWIRG
jgi:His/Glu/Gln/Arg/opine family amino acid ABC transporter permease subunit